MTITLADLQGAGGERPSPTSPGQSGATPDASVRPSMDEWERLRAQSGRTPKLTFQTISFNQRQDVVSQFGWLTVKVASMGLSVGRRRRKRFDDARHALWLYIVGSPS